MKYSSCLIVLALCFTACKKELGACKDYKEIKGRAQLLDVNSIDLKSFRDTLDKYPQLQPNRYTSDQYSKNLVCNIYYNDLLIFSDVYTMIKSNNADTIQGYGNLLKTQLPISLDPAVSHDKAIENAKKYINLDHTCISYQLGIYHLNPGVAGHDNYRLVWKIAGMDAKAMYVISDASNNQVFEANTGLYWVN